MKKIIYVLMALGLLSFSSQTHLNLIETTKLTGKVTDAQSGEALSVVNVVIYQNEIAIKGTVTDIDGRYDIELDPGIYDIVVDYIGYQSQKIVDVKIEKGKEKKVDFALSMGTMLDEVVVVDYKKHKRTFNKSASITTVTGDGLKKQKPHFGYAVQAMPTGIALDTEEGEITENEEYAEISENKPTSPFRSPLSTIAIDVDRASYSNIRRFINNGSLPHKDAVRIEEMVNYFNYDYPEPTKKTRPVNIYSELTECPWNSDNKLLHIGLQARKVDMTDLPASNLVFLIDVSGSMNQRDKMQLLKESFKLLVNTLDEEDLVSIVTYAGNAGIALEPTRIKDKSKIIQAIDALGAGGSTAGAEGIKTAYNLGRKHFKQNGNNRVILATDGDFNVGISNNEDLLKLIEKERRSGIFLSVLGFGMGNYKDAKMQLLADSGNGNHAYIDDLREAKKLLVTEMGGTLHAIAKDVKVQIEFNPAYVGAYRLIGYENRKMKAEDFRNDSKDAGEIGAGHSVTVLYEITPTSDQFTSIDDKLMYQKRSKELKNNNELGTVRVRYKTPTGYKAWEFDSKIPNFTTKLNEVEDKTKHAAAIAEFGMLLRDSKYKHNASYSSILETLNGIDENKYLTNEVITLVTKAKDLDMVK